MEYIFIFSVILLIIFLLIFFAIRKYIYPELIIERDNNRKTLKIIENSPSMNLEE